MTTALTPFDTGERCEPRPWMTYNAHVSADFPAEDFGKVDFDDDEGSTVCVVHVERREGGGHVVHVQPLGSDEELGVVVHLERGDLGSGGQEPSADAGR